MRFEDLGLGPEILKAIADCGYETPTPIQEKAIPAILMTRDIIGLAQTGTGKTASFTLPMIEILAGGRARARMPRSLVLTPTRELAAQVAANFDTYGKYHKLAKVLLVGGESMDEQVKLLERGVDVLIATPGRLLDLFERGNILLNDIKVLVIDEADRMLDMGFIPDIDKIVSLVPPIRQTLLFSATMPPEIKKLADKFLSNPKLISVSPPTSPAETVRQALVWVKERDKREALDALIRQEDVKNAFIFLNRKRDVDTLGKWLYDRGYKAAPMHGDMAQSIRTQTLLDFKEGRITLLVCSDVAARGLDIQGVSHVFNFDVPMSPEDYIHRIGRTGRAGLQGRSWTIASGEDTKFIEGIERLIKKALPVETIQDFDAPQGQSSSSTSREEGRSGNGGGGDRGGRDRGRNRGGRGGSGGGDRHRGGASQGNQARHTGSGSQPDRNRDRNHNQDRGGQKSGGHNHAPRTFDNKNTQRPQPQPQPAARRQDEDRTPSRFQEDEIPPFLRR